MVMQAPKKIVLISLLKKKCGQRVPRTGKIGEDVNCFLVFLYDKKTPYMVLETIDSNIIKGLEWNGNKYTTSIEINFSDINRYNVRILHYYGLNNIEYNSLYSYIFLGLTKFEKLRCNIVDLYHKSAQFIYNKKQLATIDRIRLLRTIIDISIKSEFQKFSFLYLMENLYTLRWISHPEGDIHEKRIELLLDSFVKSGEIEKVDHNEYIATGKAIISLSEYEEQERRHKENATLQKWLIFFTFLFVVVSTIQIIIAYINS
jgi:hypothetical protein